MRLTVLGAPGAGKGTQARNLANHFRVAHISTSDILREFLQTESSVSASIRETMNKGELVSDACVIELVKQRLAMPDCAAGYILDGYPRNINQAQALDASGFQLEKAISISVSDEVIIERISGRVACPTCGRNYHLVYYPPQKPGCCDDCGGKLLQRKDDKTQTVITRLGIYHELTTPIIEYYRSKGILLEISGIGNIEDITKSIVDSLRNEPKE